MKITKAYLKQLIKEQLDGGMNPKDKILAAFMDKGMSTRYMVEVLNAIVNLNLSNEQLSKVVQDITNEVASLLLQC